MPQRETAPPRSRRGRRHQHGKRRHDKDAKTVLRFIGVTL